MIDFPEEGICMAGIRGPFVLEDLLLAAKKANRVAPVQIVRADRVVGADHLRSAAMHSRRAFEEGRNQADDPAVEFTRYAAGVRSIKDAIAKMGVPDGHDAAVVCGLGDKRQDGVHYFIEFLGLREDDSVIDGDLESLKGFGITDTQLKATLPQHRMDLVLEAVAAVDLMRK